MQDNKLLTRVKTCLRVTSAIFDEEEILPLIEAAKIDLEGAGVDVANNYNNLIEQAVVFYCKAYFGTEPKSEWVKSYEALRNALASRRGNTDEF